MTDRLLEEIAKLKEQPSVKNVEPMQRFWCLAAIMDVLSVIHEDRKVKP